MNKKWRLLTGAILKGALGFSLLGAPLFCGAGTWRYPNAWVLLISLCACMLAFGAVLLIKHPQTLAKRLKSRESQKMQKGSVALSGLAFLISFALAGLDFRLGWSAVPLAASAAAWVLMLIGYALYCAVMLQNAYASRVVEIQAGQVVISTGLYAVVRHPMYLASLLVFLPMPLVLGSYVALVPMLLFPVSLVLRIKNEEAVLTKGLPGYSAYAKVTRYRLIPYLW